MDVFEGSHVVLYSTIISIGILTSNLERVLIASCVSTGLSTGPALQGQLMNLSFLINSLERQLYTDDTRLFVSFALPAADKLISYRHGCHLITLSFIDAKQTIY